jgi:hypothetical protein
MSDADAWRRQEEERRREERRQATRGPFERWRPYLGVEHRSSPARRLRDARWAVTQWRLAHSQRQESDDEVALGVRVTAEAFADQIQAAAGPEQDAATVAWVIAGLRCRWQPFCTGCPACQTVTAPLRPCEPIRRGPFD